MWFTQNLSHIWLGPQHVPNICLGNRSVPNIWLSCNCCKYMNCPMSPKYLTVRQNILNIWLSASVSKHATVRQSVPIIWRVSQSLLIVDGSQCFPKILLFSKVFQISDCRWSFPNIWPSPNRSKIPDCHKECLNILMSASAPNIQRSAQVSHRVVTQGVPNILNLPRLSKYPDVSQCPNYLTASQSVSKIWLSPKVSQISDRSGQLSQLCTCPCHSVNHPILLSSSPWLLTILNWLS